MSQLTTSGLGETYATTLIPGKIAEGLDEHFSGRGYAQDVNGDSITTTYPSNASGGEVVTTTSRRTINGPGGRVIEGDESMKIRHENTVKGKTGAIPPWCP